MKSYEYCVSNGVLKARNWSAPYTYSCRPEQEALRIDPLAPQPKLYGKHAAISNDGTDEDGHDDDVEPSFDNPLLHGLWYAPSETSDAFFLTSPKKVGRAPESR